MGYQAEAIGLNPLIALLLRRLAILWQPDTGWT
jgi:hypothetical protein